MKLPIDLAFEIDGKRKDISTNKFPINHKVLDIGKETIKMYEKEILKAKRVFWKGTAGDCSYKDFCFLLFCTSTHHRLHSPKHHG